jgi:holo-[acyl-carrier protein] synthase
VIIGIGTDIIRVDRIQKSMDANPGFGEKLFTSSETTYCEARASKHQSYAARFAAKEAVMKALGTGWNERVHWLDIEILRDGDEAPRVLLHGETKRLADELGVSAIHLTMSHEQKYATAFVVLEN